MYLWDYTYDNWNITRTITPAKILHGTQLLYIVITELVSTLRMTILIGIVIHTTTMTTTSTNGTMPMTIGIQHGRT